MVVAALGSVVETAWVCGMDVVMVGDNSWAWVCNLVSVVLWIEVMDVMVLACIICFGMILGVAGSLVLL